MLPAELSANASTWQMNNKVFKQKQKQNDALQLIKSVNNNTERDNVTEKSTKK
jgi:hypothetical protein